MTSGTCFFQKINIQEYYLGMIKKSEASATGESWGLWSPYDTADDFSPID